MARRKTRRNTTRRRLKVKPQKKKQAKETRSKLFQALPSFLTASRVRVYNAKRLAFFWNELFGLQLSALWEVGDVWSTWFAGNAGHHGDCASHLRPQETSFTGKVLR